MEVEGLKRGDIIKNNHAGNVDPYLVYLRKGTIRQGRYTHKSYDCLSSDGRKVQLFRDTADIIKVGHMEEFDAFMSALNALKSM